MTFQIGNDKMISCNFVKFQQVININSWQ